VGNQRERNRLKDLDMHEKIILKCILNERVVRVYTSLIWFRIWTTGMFL
jgi:hypothetical protein